MYVYIYIHTQYSFNSFLGWLHPIAGNHLAEDKTRYMVNPVAPVILRPAMMERLGALLGA